jgi:hypothetical protein
MKSVVYASAGTTAAKVAGEHPEMDAVADRMAAAIVTTAAPHTRTGGFVGSVSVRRVRGKRGVTDRLVEVTDPAAEHIEFGHATRDAVDGDAGDLRWIPGLHIVSRAYQGLR